MSRRRWRQNATVGFLACSYCLWPSALGFAGPGGCDKAARDYLTEYCTEIAPEDQVSNKGEALSDAVAILQQDRFNVHVKGLRRKGDSVDAYFAGTTHCVEIAGAMLTIDKETSAAIVDGNPSLLLDVYRHKSNGRLEFSVGVSGEAAPRELMLRKRCARCTRFPCNITENGPIRPIIAPGEKRPPCSQSIPKVCISRKGK